MEIQNPRTKHQSEKKKNQNVRHFHSEQEEDI